jgi:hypothetical protein
MRVRLPRLFLLASRVHASLFFQSPSPRTQLPFHLSYLSNLSTMSVNPLTATASKVQAKLADGSVTSKALVQLYLNQITRHND